MGGKEEGEGRGRGGGLGGGGGDGDLEDAAGARGDFVAIVETVADDPHDVVVGLEDEAVAFLLGAELEVGEEVADFLAAAFHAQGAEGVAGGPVTEEEGVDDFVEVDGGDVGVAGDDVVGGEGELGEGEGVPVDVVGARVGEEGAGGEGVEEVEEAPVGAPAGEEVFAGLELFAWGGAGGGEHVGDLGGVEAVGVEDFVEEGVGSGGVEEALDVDEGFAVLDVDGVAAEGGDAVEVDLLGVAEGAVGVLEGFEEGGVDLLEDGYDEVAYFIAGVVEGVVGGVGAVPELVGADVVQDVLAGEGEDGPQDAPADGGDAGEAADAGAAGEVEEGGFGVVVGVVGDEDVVEFALEAGFLEPGVAEFAGGHLDADAAGGGVGPGVEFADAEGDAVGVAEAFDELLVHVGFFPAEVEVAVEGEEVEVEVFAGVEEGDGVGAAAEGDDELGGGVDVVLGEESRDGLLHVSRFFCFVLS